jgi:hypothetical protein
MCVGGLTAECSISIGPSATVDIAALEGIAGGYGVNLIRDLIPHELGGAVDLTFQSDGACCKIEIPL